MAPVLKILGVPRLPPGGSLGTGKRGTVPKIWRAVPIFFSACKWGLRHKTGLCCGIWRYCERSFPILTGGEGLLPAAVASPCWLRLMPLSQSIATVQTNYEVSCKVLHSRKVVQFKALLHICYWSLYLATELSTFSLASLNVTFFAAVPFLAHPRVLRNWNCFTR